MTIMQFLTWLFSASVAPWAFGVTLTITLLIAAWQPIVRLFEPKRIPYEWGKGSGTHAHQNNDETFGSKNSGNSQ